MVTKQSLNTALVTKMASGDDSLIVELLKEVGSRVNLDAAPNSLLGSLESAYPGCQHMIMSLVLLYYTPIEDTATEQLPGTADFVSALNNRDRALREYLEQHSNTTIYAIAIDLQVPTWLVATANAVYDIERNVQGSHKRQEQAGSQAWRKLGKQEQWQAFTKARKYGGRENICIALRIHRQEMIEWLSRPENIGFRSLYLKDTHLHNTTKRMVAMQANHSEWRKDLEQCVSIETYASEHGISIQSAHARNRLLGYPHQKETGLKSAERLEQLSAFVRDTPEANRHSTRWFARAAFRLSDQDMTQANFQIVKKALKDLGWMNVGQGPRSCWVDPKKLTDLDCQSLASKGHV